MLSTHKPKLSISPYSIVNAHLLSWARDTMKTTNPIVPSLPASAYAERSFKSAQYGLYFASLSGSTEAIGLPGDAKHQTIYLGQACNVVAGEAIACKWSGTQGLPRIGERVLIAMPYKCEGTVLAYFVEDGWLGCELLPDSRPAHVNAKTHPHALMFGLDLTRELGAVAQSVPTAHAEELQAIRANLGLPLDASRADVLATIDRLKLSNTETVERLKESTGWLDVARNEITEELENTFTPGLRKELTEQLAFLDAHRANVKTAIARAEGTSAPGLLTDQEARELAGYLHTRHKGKK